MNSASRMITTTGTPRSQRIPALNTITPSLSIAITANEHGAGKFPIRSSTLKFNREMLVFRSPALGQRETALDVGTAGSAMFKTELTIPRPRMPLDKEAQHHCGRVRPLRTSIAPLGFTDDHNPRLPTPSLAPHEGLSDLALPQSPARLVPRECANLILIPELYGDGFAPTCPMWKATDDCEPSCAISPPGSSTSDQRPAQCQGDQHPEDQDHRRADSGVDAVHSIGIAALGEPVRRDRDDQRAEDGAENQEGQPIH